MHRLSIYFLIGFAAMSLMLAAARAEDAGQSQIDAANYDAVDRLRADIVAQPLSPDLSIADFLRATSGEHDLMDTLRHADQIGGARWVDNDTCQVKLTITSDLVRKSLVKIATDNPQKSPLPPEAITAKLKAWNNRTFTATGSAVTPARAELLRPQGAIGQWNNVPDAARRQTIRDARAAAVQHVIDSIKPIEIAPKKTVADLLADKAIGDSLRQWLLSRPVTRLEFTNNLSVQITLAAGPGHTFDALHDLAMASKNPATNALLPVDQAALAKIRVAFQDQMASAIGQATVIAAPANPAAPNGGIPNGAAPNGAAPAGAAPAIPNQPPDWVGQQLNGEATAAYHGTTLKTELNAQNAAMDDLRSKVGQLPLGAGTIAGAMKQNPAIGKAVEQAVGQAKAYKIDFLSDGRVTVKVSLDAQAIWEALRELP